MVVLLGITLALALLVGCATHSDHLNPAQAEALRARAESHFAHAFSLKPAGANATSSPAKQFAPLLLIEAPGPNPLPDWQARTCQRPSSSRLARCN